MLGEVSLIIPAWQMGLFVGLISFLVFTGHLQFGLSVMYFYILYWGFLLHWPEFVGAAGGDPWALTLYISCGLVVVFLATL